MKNQKTEGKKFQTKKVAAYLDFIKTEKKEEEKIIVTCCEKILYLFFVSFFVVFEKLF